VLGGLIREEVLNVQSKIPIAGDIPWVGAAFQRRQVVRSRTEIIITILPRVVPFEPAAFARNEIEFNRAATPLFRGPLHEIPRPFEPQLPDPLRRAAEAYWRLRYHHLAPVLEHGSQHSHVVLWSPAPHEGFQQRQQNPARHTPSHLVQPTGFTEDAPPLRPRRRGPVRYTVTDR